MGANPEKYQYGYTKSGEWPLEFCTVIDQLVNLREKFLSQPITKQNSSGHLALFVNPYFSRIGSP